MVYTLSILTVLFVCLKLAHVIAWSWWIVLIPTFVDLGFFAIGLVFTLVLIIIKALNE
jgi:hypothetical protein